MLFCMGVNEKYSKCCVFFENLILYLAKDAGQSR